MGDSGVATSRSSLLALPHAEVSALGSLLRVGLLLYHRLGWLRGCYRIRVPMHDLPGAVIGPEDHRYPQGDRGDICPSAYLGLGPLHPYDVGKLGSHVLLCNLEASDLAIPELRRGALHGGGDLH